MTFGERILKTRLDKGLTQEELAKKAGYKSRSTIAKIEAGERDAPQSMIVALAKALGTTPSYLMGWDEIEETIDFLESITDPDKTSQQVKERDKAIRAAIAAVNSEFSIEKSPIDYVKIPVIGSVAAGTHCLADMEIEEYIACDSSMINDSYEYCYLKVTGDSMEPLIRENDLVLVRIQSDVDSGSYAVVLVDDENGLVKRVEKDAEQITLISENPYYPPRHFKKENMNRIRIFGLVVETRRRFV